jgi:uncharacterized protein YyaL (SSP411 family)
MFTRLFFILAATSIISGCGRSSLKEATMTHDHTNALVNETSPYLLQHAHNPVDWHPWGEEALEKAAAENKLVLISIGYSACHWCHVMEHETFEDSAAAAYMNEHFINIKVDREERPDVDQVYMNAVQLMTGSGGWPLNCFALPDGRPIFGGTYFPKGQWIDRLEQLVDLKTQSPDKLIEYAENLTQGVQQSELIEVNTSEMEFHQDSIMAMVGRWNQYWDREEGGPNRAPKFPLPNNYEFLLKYSQIHNDVDVSGFVHTTLDKMAQGGIYDQVGGGFARYSTDMMWKVPHFEKMLYDNAQLISLYSEAYRQKANQDYRKVVYESIAFVQRELTDKTGAFYSALDADSEGEEGKFYVWSKEEMQEVLGEDYDFAKEYFNVNPTGKWEGHYIPLRRMGNKDFAGQNGYSETSFNETRDRVIAKLMERRDTRIRPGLDDKSLTSWNALMVKGLCDAYLSFGEQEFLDQALRSAEFIFDKQRKKDGGLWHSYKDGTSKINGYLEDYCFAIEACIALYQATFDDQWLGKGKELADYSIEHFYDEASKMFWFTSNDDPPLIARKQELSDNVIPASNSSMAKGLFLLGSYFYDTDYLTKAEQMLHNMQRDMQFGQNFSNWGILFLMKSSPFYEVAVTGPEAKQVARDLIGNYHPNMMLYGGEEESTLPLLEGKFLGETTIFVCQNRSCQLPVSQVTEALEQMK